MALALKVPPPYAEVALCTYELHGTSALNAMTRSAGLGGAYHVGVEVYWLEWSFGWCEEGSGVYMVHPGQSSLGSFHERVPLGRTPLTPREVLATLDDLRNTWKGSSYDLLQMNCAHFSVEFVRRLRVDDAPAWVNSLAKVGDAMVNSLGLQGAQEAADAATPPVEQRSAPTFADFDSDDSDLEDAAMDGNDLAMRELAWRRAQDYVLNRTDEAERSERFVDWSFDFRWGVPAASLWGGDADLAEVAETKALLLHHQSFRLAVAEILGAAFRVDRDLVRVLWMRAQPADSVRVRFRVKSGERPAAWPPALPEKKDFDSTFKARLYAAARAAGDCPYGYEGVLSDAEVVAAPGQAVFGAAVETPSGRSGTVVHAAVAWQTKDARKDAAAPKETLARLQRLSAQAKTEADRSSRLLRLAW